MAKKIWRYTLTGQEQTLWDCEDMKGWREAMTACVEDDAREEGCRKFILYDQHEAVMVKAEVSALPELEPVTR